MKRLVFILFFFPTIFALAENVSFQSSVSKNPVAVGDRFQVVFTLHNTQGSGFKAPSFKGFSVLSGPNQSQSTQWINGQVSSSVSYIYVVQADVEGKFTIESASVNAGGKKLSSNPITVTVQKASAQQKQKSNDEKSLGKQADEVIKKNLFIRLEVNKSSVYQGEQLVATYRLYIHPEMNIVNMSPPKMPSFNGFWMQDLEIKELKFSRQMLDGVAYKAADLKKIVLIPQQTGNLTIDQMEIDFVVRLQVRGGRRQSRDMWDDFFDDPFFRGNYRDFNYTVKSRNASLSVKALPSGAPAEYKGSVGSMQMKAWLDKTQAKANEAVTLKVQVSGSGNLKLVDAFPLKLPPDIDSYEPKTVDNISVSASGVSGSKTFEYYLIPRNAGEYKIEPVKFVYFDLNQKEYISLNSESFLLKVSPGSGNVQSTLISGVNKEDVKYIGKDIRFIKNDNPSFRAKGYSYFKSFWFIFLLFLPIFLFILFFIYKRRQDKLSGNQTLLKNKRANSIAKKRLSSAKKYLVLNNENNFYEEISKALWGYSSDKLGIPFAELTKESASDALRKKSVPEEQIELLIKTLDYAESARFAPNAGKVGMGAVYADSETIIASLEGLLK